VYSATPAVETVKTILTTRKLPVTSVVAVAETLTPPLTVDPGVGWVRQTCTL